MMQLHIFIDGESSDIDISSLDIGDASSDQQIREAAASYLAKPLSKLNNFMVDRNADTGDITLRPQASFG